MPDAWLEQTIEMVAAFERYEEFYSQHDGYEELTLGQWMAIENNDLDVEDFYDKEGNFDYEAWKEAVGY